MPAPVWSPTSKPAAPTWNPVLKGPVQGGTPIGMLLMIMYPTTPYANVWNALTKPAAPTWTPAAKP